MKKSISYVLTLALFCSMLSPAIAVERTILEADQRLAKLEYYAYMDLETADTITKGEILEARNEIILSESWAADGIYAYVSDPDGNIVNVLPQFSELFPSDWDVPSFQVSDSIVATESNMGLSMARAWHLLFNGSVWLNTPPSSGNSPSFCSIATTGFVGTPSEYYIETISAWGTYNYPGFGGTYNLGFSNRSTGALIVWQTNLPNGNSLSVRPPRNITVDVRASTFSLIGNWGMQVHADRY